MKLLRTMPLVAGCSLLAFGCSVSQKESLNTGAASVTTAATGTEPSTVSVGEPPGPTIPDRVRVSDGRSVRGYVLLSAMDARRARNVEWATGPEVFSAETGAGSTLEANERRQALFAALNMVDPIDVTDEQGNRVGYMADTFVSLEDYPARLAEAKALLADEAARRAAER